MRRRSTLDCHMLTNGELWFIVFLTGWLAFIGGSALTAWIMLAKGALFQ